MLVLRDQSFIMKARSSAKHSRKLKQFTVKLCEDISCSFEAIRQLADTLKETEYDHNKRHSLNVISVSA
jgi:hypothetical protein